MMFYVSGIPCPTVSAYTDNGGWHPSSIQSYAHVEKGDVSAEQTNGGSHDVSQT